MSTSTAGRAPRLARRPRPADRLVLRHLGARQRLPLPRPERRRRQLDAPARLRLPDHADRRAARRASGPAGSTALALSLALAYNLTPYLMLIPYRLASSPQNAGVLAAGGRLPRRARRRVSAGSRSSRPPRTGSPTGSRARVSRSPAAGTASSTRRSTRCSTHPHLTGAEVPRLAATDGDRVRAAPEDQARPGRRPRRGAAAALGQRRAARRVRLAAAGRSTRCPTRRRC